MSRESPFSILSARYSLSQRALRSSARTARWPRRALAEVAGMFAAVFGLLAVAAVIALACDVSWRAISRLCKKDGADRNAERTDDASGEE